MEYLELCSNLPGVMSIVLTYFKTREGKRGGDGGWPWKFSREEESYGHLPEPQFPHL